ncbi:GIN domain-containing protein [Polaribacter porphyrae]|uniref:Putative auto-transporter adhesin head GIN domain-containing protein n=1 Tax=Polaribacter porphyrae TaxID=1137780 RepID=A0A2S7WQZ4_9FLAO|nr:DUF2807 domain-containing protein [Polaribacter porphyrae]PQJ80003.1 hypothetical protein BTO18_12850 [Polaribacter porphyrae]
MKKIIIIALLVSSSIIAQTKGNETIETRSFSIDNLTNLHISLYAKITIDQSLKEGMTITTDANLFDKIETSVEDGKLDLNQKEWIQPSKKMVITISAPNLKRIEKGTHETLILKNLNAEYLNLMAHLGKIVASGNVEQLNLGIENGTIDASKTIAENVRVNIWGYGKAKVFAENEIYSIIKNDGRLELVNTPESLKGDTKKALKKNKKLAKNNISWISFKIKNNSWNRNNFFVVGPKQNGSKFSYGFPMMPGAKRNEKWSIGSKIYKVNKLGLRKLLVEIKAEDEGKVVDLF